MPLSNYDEHFGGKPGSAQEAYDAMVSEYGEEKGKQVFYAKVNKLKKASKMSTDSTDVQKADHGRLFDQFSAQPSHVHGGSYFDAGFGLQTLQAAHGRLYDLFGVPRDTDAAHGERYDEFGWEAMPAIHGQQFDTDFRTGVPDDAHGNTTWFDVFRGGTQARFMYDGRDYEGTVIDVNRDRAVVRSRDGQTREVGLSQFLEYRTPNEQQADPPFTPSDAEAPSAHSPDAHGAVGEHRAPVPTDMPPVVQEAPQSGERGEYREPRSGMPEGLMDTFEHLKTLAAEDDVEKSAGLASVHTGSWHGTAKKIGAWCSAPACQKARPTDGKAQKFEVRAGNHPLHSVPCANCGGNVMYTHVGGSRPGDSDTQVGKSVDVTETAVQGSPSDDSGGGGKTVSHRANCPRGGSEPCGADVNGHCTVCKASVRDHEAVGKAFGSAGDALAGGQTVTINPDGSPGGRSQATSDPPDVDVPQRDHKTSDHHMKLNAGQPGRCPHCGGALEQIDEATEHGQPSRREKQGAGSEFDTVEHKCVGTGLDVLKTLVRA